MVIEVTKMNSSSMPVAPRSNRPRSSGNTAVPTVVVWTSIPSIDDAVASPRRREAAKSPPIRSWSVRATRIRAACWSTTERTIIATCWALRSARDR